MSEETKSQVKVEDWSEMRAFSLHGHTRPVKKIRFNRDGDMFFTCSDDKLICAWNKDMVKMGVYKGPGACKSLAVSYNTEYIVGAFTTEGLAVYEATTGKQLCHYKKAGERVINVDFNYGDSELAVVVLGTGKSFVRLYDFKDLLRGNNSPKKELVFRSENVSQATWGLCNRYLYIASNAKEAGYMSKWDTSEDFKAPDLKEKIHNMEIFSFSFSADFTMIATCSKDKYTKILSPDDFSEWVQFNKKAPSRCACFSPLANPDSMEKFHIIIGGGQDAKDVTMTGEKAAGFESRIFNLITGEELASLKGHFGPVHSIEISPDGRSLVTCSEDGTIRMQRFPLEYLEDEKF